MGHIFISYSHKDKEYVHTLRNALISAGFDVWIDDRIDYGTRWPKVIQDQLDACQAFIVVISANSYDSEWVQNEVARAKRKGKPFFPLLLSGEPWLSVEATQYFDVRDGTTPDERFYARLATAATRRKDGGLPPVQRPKVPENRIKSGSVSRIKPAYVIGCVGILAVAVLAVWGVTMLFKQIGLLSSSGGTPTGTPDAASLPMSSTDASLSHGNLIAYAMDGDIYTINIYGSQMTQLTSDPSDDYRPRWSPDGSRIAFGSDRSGRDAIYIMNMNGSNIIREVELKGGPYVKGEFSWSPDGKKIIYADTKSESSQDTDLYVVDLENLIVTPLTVSSDWDHSPEWSPDGQSIVFMRWAALASTSWDGNPLLYLMDSDGANIRVITDHDSLPFCFFDPAWSPDGLKIAFSGCNGDLFTMNSDGTNITSLTVLPESRELFPSWSPDGTRIVFEFNGGTKDFSTPMPPELSSIFVMDSNGANKGRLTRGNTPSWQP
jgi:Tol biopolymer transport system component